jgi:hypothetical protein
MIQQKEAIKSCYTSAEELANSKQICWQGKQPCVDFPWWYLARSAFFLQCGLGRDVLLPFLDRAKEMALRAGGNPHQTYARPSRNLTKIQLAASQPINSQVEEIIPRQAVDP